MKNVLFIVFAAVMSFLMIGCSITSGTLPTPAGITIKIFRDGTAGIIISGDSAKLNYDTREVIISSPKVFGFYTRGFIVGTSVENWVAEISIQENKLIAHMPEDGKYDIWIGDKYNLLPKRK
jgi:hypothetical protein